MRRRRMSRDVAIAVAKVARTNPDFVNDLRDDPSQQHIYNYVRSVLTNDEIKAWCKAERVTDHHELMDRLKTEKPEWFEHLNENPGSKVFIAVWLERSAWAKEKDRT